MFEADAAGEPVAALRALGYALTFRPSLALRRGTLAVAGRAVGRLVTQRRSR